jgi:glycosyltransferase involved in cell wall biosynthesis
MNGGANRRGKQGAILLMPRWRREGPPIAALWTLAAGWASASRRRFGNTWIVTRDGVASPEQVLSFADPPRGTRTAPTPRFRHAPMVLRNAAKDIVRIRAGRAFRDVDEQPVWQNHEIVFVWQYHSLFQSAGESVARRHSCPLISFVDAPQVWEGRRWGVARPVWGRFAERYGEAPQLRASDVVACASDEVAVEVRRLGVRAERIMVSPMAVDAEQFTDAQDGNRVRRELGLDDAFVVGWAGTFRRFQGLETLVEGFVHFRRTYEAARLLLVGDGAERARIVAMADKLGVRDAVVFTGALAPRDVPAHLYAMDVAVVSSRPGDAFHYSPLKLREYLACGRATLAPRVGEIPEFVTDNVDACLYCSGDANDLAAKLGELAADPARRARLGSAGRTLVLATATWDVRLTDLVESAPFGTAVDRWSQPG